jgi:hypothetical protein
MRVVVRSVVVAVMGFVMLPHASWGQVVPRPDTTGANFDASKPGTGTTSDFDFLIGQWRFQLQARDPKTGAYGPVQRGIWTAAKTHEGMIVEDQFSTDQPNGTHSLLMTYRVYDTVNRNWTIQGIQTRVGSPWQPGAAWASGADRLLVQSHPAIGRMTRIRYYNITPNHFQWRSDGSADGGKTWLADVLLIEATRIQP